MSKDWLRPNVNKEDPNPQKNKLRSFCHPNGRDRKNRLRRDFESDISIRADQRRMKNGLFEDNGALGPHDYL